MFHYTNITEIFYQRESMPISEAYHPMFLIASRNNLSSRTPSLVWKQLKKI